MTSKINLIASIVAAGLALIPTALSGQTSKKDLGLNTVVIDPGHGGKDPGALGQSSSSHEKHIVLSISKLFGQKIKDAYPDVKVIYTRSTDKFIGLHDRAMVARNNNADLFISVHCNSSSSKSAYGSSVHILGQKSDRKTNTTDYFERNMSVAQRENEVIVMEEGYETRYTHFDPETPEAYIGYALQWKAHYESSLLFAAEVVENLMVKPLQARKIAIDQDIFQVLVEANMPAVLLELAFISNPTEYKYLSSKDGQEAIAERLFQAFRAYKTQYDMSLNIDVREPVEASSSATVSQDQPEKDKNKEGLTSFYTIQIMSVAKLLKEGDPALKGLKTEAYLPAGTSTYKYIVGKFKTREEAKAELSKVKAAFPQAFIIYIDNK
ncbi:MAG: N-acetylmuramoyl-L-alanine amidase [Bacteroidales bacterium]|nr:N-acetylmuramoyl-L-alanine amidase [Bacteroidales bacterium]